jgi:plasmid stabilization system protein ParE
MNDYAFHPEAFEDLDEIWEFIAKDNIDAADRVIEDIFETIRGLVPFPQRGHRRPDLTTRPLRFIRVYDYLIAYTPEESPLCVIAVLHGKRNPRVMAATCEKGKNSDFGAVAFLAMVRDTYRLTVIVVWATNRPTGSTTGP